MFKKYKSLGDSLLTLVVALALLFFLSPIFMKALPQAVHDGKIWIGQKMSHIHIPSASPTPRAEPQASANIPEPQTVKQELNAGKLIAKAGKALANILHDLPSILSDIREIPK